MNDLKENNIPQGQSWYISRMLALGLPTLQKYA